MRLCCCKTFTGGGEWWCTMWRQMSWEQKGPFLPKLEDGSGSSFFPTFKEVQENCWHLKKWKMWFMVTSCITQANLFQGRFFFFFNDMCNNGIVIHSWRRIGSDSSPFCCLYPTPTFPFLLCQFLGVSVLMWATEESS